MISIHNLSFHYPRIDEDVLSDVSFEVPNHSLTILEGPSGCGKTALINLLRGELAPLQGKIEIDRTSLFYGDSECSNNGILSVLDNLLLETKDLKAINDVLQEVGLSGEKKTLAADLSKGEKARLMLARVLILKPKTVLLDEPSANLDPSSTKMAYCLLTKLSKTSSVLVATHDPAALCYANQIISLKNGVSYVKAGKEAKDTVEEPTRVPLPSHKAYLKLGLKRFFHYPVIGAFRLLGLAMMLICSFLSFAMGSVDKNATYSSAIDKLDGLYQCQDTSLEDSPSSTQIRESYPAGDAVPCVSFLQYKFAFLEDVKEWIPQDIDEVYQKKDYYSADCFPVFWNSKINYDNVRFSNDDSKKKEIREGDYLNKDLPLVVSGFFDFKTEVEDEQIQAVIPKKDYLSFFKTEGIRYSGFSDLFGDFISSYKGSHSYSHDYFGFSPIILSATMAGLTDEEQKDWFPDEKDIYINNRFFFDWLSELKEAKDPYLSGSRFSCSEDSSGSDRFTFSSSFSELGLGKVTLNLAGAIDLQGDNYALVSDDFFAELLASPYVQGEKAQSFFLTSRYLKTQKSRILDSSLKIGSNLVSVQCPLALENSKTMTRFLLILSGILAGILVLLSLLFGVRSREEFRKDALAFKEWGIPKKYPLLSDLSLSLTAVFLPLLISLLLSPSLARIIGQIEAASQSFAGLLCYSLTRSFLFTPLLALAVFGLLFVWNMPRESKNGFIRK
jgi:ABC-type multidrug transport system ATPase subunit